MAINRIPTDMIIDRQSGQKLSDKLSDIAKLHWVDVTQPPYNVKGDGTDETTAMQLALDYASNNKRVFYVPSYITVSVSNLVVTSKSNFGVRVDGTIKFINNAPASATCLKLDTCTDVNIYSFNSDGNVANNGVTLSEQLHLLRLLNCSRVFIGTIIGKNPTGDVVYINNCTDIISDKLYGYGSNVGRNTLSIIKGSRMEFSNIVSVGVGTEAMPSGVDLEPNTVSDAITDIQFGNVYVEGIGTGAFTLYNNWGADCKNVIVNNLIVNKPTPSTLNKRGLHIDRFNNVSIKAKISEKQAVVANLKTVGVHLDGGDNINLDLDVSNVNLGVRIGLATAVNRLKLTGKVYDTVDSGLEITRLTSSVIDGLKVNQADKLASNVIWNVRFVSSATVSDVKFKNCDFSKGASGYRAVSANGTLSNVWFEDCDFTGWSTLNEMFSGAYTTGVFRKNNKALNYLSATPSAYYWNVGEVIWNTVPSAAGKIGWVCTTAGTVGSGAVFKPFGAIDA